MLYSFVSITKVALGAEHNADPEEQVADCPLRTFETHRAPPGPQGQQAWRLGGKGSCIRTQPEG